MDKKQKKLIRLFSDLDADRQSALLEYAEFLAGRSSRKNKPGPTPELIPRPDNETVIGAVKRLSTSYTMLDKQYMLHELSGLMAQHMLQGRAADEVIDEVEKVFEKQYQVLMEKQEG